MLGNGPWPGSERICKTEPSLPIIEPMTEKQLPPFEPGRQLPSFVPGMELCRRFYEEAVRPLLVTNYSQLLYSAGRLDRGSDVLGFDTHQSRDHHWGPKVTLFLTEADLASLGESIMELMARQLPFEVMGYPTHFANPDIDGGLVTYTNERPINHGVMLATVRGFTEEYLGVDATQAMDDLAWLTMPSQHLCTLRSGRVFHDGLGLLGLVRQRLDWYPHDIWLYLMANQWRRIDQLEPFLGRCGDVGDELGSRLIGARLIDEIMKLVFLIERQYAPYAKWFGSAFARLENGERLAPIFHNILDEKTWRERESWMNQAYLHLGEMHNKLGVTRPVEVRVAPFHSRPYLVPHSDRFVEALHEAIKSETVKVLPRHVGGVGQFVDSTDILDSVERLKALGVIYSL